MFNGRKILGRKLVQKKHVHQYSTVTLRKTSWASQHLKTKNKVTNTKKDRKIYLFNKLQGGRATQCSIQPLCGFYPPHFCNLYSILQVVAFNTQHHMICIIYDFHCLKISVSHCYIVGIFVS